MFREEKGENLRDGSGTLWLPSASITAQRLVALAERPTVSGPELWRVVRGDPAMVLALLQAVGRERRRQNGSGSLCAAIERLGAQTALHICLRFRLIERPVAHVDYVRCWRQALLRSAYACAIARRLRRADWACIQTAAVLRNIGGLMSGCVDGENARSDATWLAAQGVSTVICDLVNASYGTFPNPGDSEDAAACILLAVSMSEVWLSADWERTTAQTQALAQSLFGAVPDLCTWVFGVLGPQASDLETLLQIRFTGRRTATRLYQSARRLRMPC